MQSSEKRKEYVLNYYQKQYHEYGINPDQEIRDIGKILFENVKGKTLDFGCGPALHFWGFFMKDATIIDGMDITPENIEFLQKYIKNINLDEYRGLELYISDLAKNQFSLFEQMKKIRKVLVGDFTKQIEGIDNDYDTIVAPFSIGCVKNIKDYNKAIFNMQKHLKPGGKAILFGTTGNDISEIIPEYQFQGVKNNADVLRKIFNNYYRDVTIEEIKVNVEDNSMFLYPSIVIAMGYKE
ncbi:MAG: class I SAM-dependent methyltransferase [bacterium]